MSKLLLSLVCTAVLMSGQTTFPMTGKEVPELLPFEQAARRVMEKYQVPGASLAIADGSRLIYARGLGWADREANEPVRPLSRFRFASISKTITGMTILKLAEEGKINLDLPFQSYLPDLKPATQPAPDPRMSRVTVRQLLLHTWGVDREVGDDHTVYFNTASRLFNEPVSYDVMARYIMSQRLDFEPGTKFAYSNSGYQLLGRIIERVHGKKYVEAIYDKVLRAPGVTSIEIGGNLLSQRKADEVRYYDYPGAPLSTAVVAPGAAANAPRQYNWRVDMSDSYGGLIGTSVDAMRFLLSLDGKRGPALLNKASLDSVEVRPAVWPGTGTYWGLTWRVTPVNATTRNWWHTGGAPGTRNLMHKRADGRSWVILMNLRPQDEDAIITDLFNEFQAAGQQVRTWPTHDLFPDFAAPVMTLSADTLSFTHAAGSTAAPAEQTLQIALSGANASGTLVVETPAETWLKVDRLSGAAPLTLKVSVEPAGLAPGDYTATLRINSPQAANSPRTVRVSLQVTRAPAPEAMRNSASRLVTQEAAPESRLTVHGAGIGDGVTVTLVDSSGAEAAAPLFAVGPDFADVVIPAGASLGDATLRALTSAGRLYADRVTIVGALPALFSAAGDGQGAALATVVRTAEDGTEISNGPAYACTDGACTATPIDMGAETERVVLRLAMTGTRAVTDPAAYAVKAGDELCEVMALAPSDTQAGVDWLSVRLPRALAGRGGEVDVVVTVAERASNPVKIAVQ